MPYLYIAGGKLKGKRIYTPSFIRPTQKKVKKAIFDILGYKILNSLFLDLFAGSGNIGIEAISRGCKSCFFVEKNEKCVSIIKKNLNDLKISDSFKIVRRDASKFVNSVKSKFDIIFADPPYNYKLKRRFVEDVIKILSRNGIFILEISKREKTNEFDDLIKREEMYGETKILFFGNLSG